MCAGSGTIAGITGRSHGDESTARTVVSPTNRRDRRRHDPPHPRRAPARRPRLARRARPPRRPLAAGGGRARLAPRARRRDHRLPRADRPARARLRARRRHPRPARAARSSRKVAELARETPEVVECHRITGEDCFFMKAHVRDVEHLEEVIDRFVAVRPDDDVDRAVVAGPGPRDRAVTPWGRAPRVPRRLVLRVLRRRRRLLRQPGRDPVAVAADRARRVRDLPVAARPRVVPHPARRLSRRAHPVPLHLGRVHRRVRVQQRGPGPRGRRRAAVPDQDRRCPTRATRRSPRASPSSWSTTSASRSRSSPSRSRRARSPKPPDFSVAARLRPRVLRVAPALHAVHCSPCSASPRWSASRCSPRACARSGSASARA